MDHVWIIYDPIQSNHFIKRITQVHFVLASLTCKLMTRLFIKEILEGWHANDPLFNRDGSTHLISCEFSVMSKLTIFGFLSMPCKHLCSWYMKRFQVDNFGSDWYVVLSPRFHLSVEFDQVIYFARFELLSQCSLLGHCFFSFDFASFNWGVNPILVNVQRLS